MTDRVKSLAGDDRRHTRALARGTVLAAAGKITQLIDPLGMLVFAHLYGAETLGLYVVLMAYVDGASRATIFAMPKTLQRFVPANPDDAHAIVRIAMIVPVVTGIVAALTISLTAPVLAGLIRIGPASGGGIAPAVGLCGWLIPLRALMRVPLNAVRARQQFGPDMYIRTLIEPLIWLVAGTIFSAADPGLYGLVGARLVSFGTAALLSLGVLVRRFDLEKLLRPAPASRRSLWADMLGFSAVTVIYDFMHYLEGRLDVLLLGALLSGPSGAAAVGAYGVARTLSGSVIWGRKSMDYAVGPIASELHARREIDSLRESYAATTRWELCLSTPIIATILTLRTDILGLFGPEFLVASTAVVILCVGRALDEITGSTALILAMIGRPQAPLFNEVAATALSATLMWALVPSFGITGAALAASAGFAVANLAAFVEIWIILGIQPYDRRFLRAFSFSCAGVTVLLAAQWLAAQTGLGFVNGRIEVTAVWAVAFIPAYLRYGLPAEDRALANEGLERLRARVQHAIAQSG